MPPPIRTRYILDKYRKEINILLYEKKQGAAAARNRGILNARGKFIAFTDADCLVDRDWLANIISPLQDARVGIVGGRILSARPYSEIERFGEKIFDHNRAINQSRPPFVGTMNWASRRSVLIGIGLFDEDFIRSQNSVDLASFGSVPYLP